MELFRISSLFALFLILDVTSALYFHIAEAERKCFIEEIPDDTTVIVDYKLELYDPRSGCFMPPTPGTGMHVEARDPNKKVLFSRVYLSEGLLSFKSDTPGEHVICMHSNSTSSFNGSQFRVHLDFQVGVQAIDYANIAVKYNLTVLELRVRQLLNQVYQITMEQRYQKHREERFRQTSESINHRLLWWSLLQTGVFVGIGYWQKMKIQKLKYTALYGVFNLEVGCIPYCNK